MTLEDGLNRLAASYRAQGYEVVSHPVPDQLPEFARDFRVELVGRRGSGGVLVAVKRDRNDLASDPNTPRYADLVAAQPGWRFDLAVLAGDAPDAQERGTQEFTPEDIADALGQADELKRLGHAQFALIPAWSAFEAAMRMRLRSLGQRAGWGSQPGQMVRELYSAGAFTPSEFRIIGTATQVRNQLVHGFRPQIDAAVGTDLLSTLANATKRLVEESQPSLFGP